MWLISYVTVAFPEPLFIPAVVAVVVVVVVVGYTYGVIVMPSQLLGLPNISQGLNTSYGGHTYRALLPP